MARSHRHSNKRAIGLALASASGAALLGLTTFTASASAANYHGAGTVWIPDSSVQAQGDHGTRAHTNIRTLIPYEGVGSLTPPQPQATPSTSQAPAPSTLFETPASLACVYHLVSPTPAGCNPNVTTLNPTGGSHAIAIVDAFDDPSAAADLARFSQQFGLPAANFHVVYANGPRPALDRTGGWELEESLDIEWAHAMAPHAALYLVEAASASFADLLKAVSVASTLVAQNGGGEVSMSWGSSEFATETAYDSAFTTHGVVYIASAGDSPGTEFPSISPNVVSAGGTSTDRNPATGSFEQENAWQVTGGGSSTYEPRPAYQNAIAAIVGANRGVPDIAFDADPNTGVWVFDAGYWYIVGGTSVAAPALAGIINSASRFNTSSAAELAQLYGGIGSATLRDVTAGNCGPYAGYLAAAGWDFCTGVGTPIGYTGK